MENLTRALLSGASLFALMVGGGTAAQAQACNPAGGASYTNAGICDYIDIDGDYTGDVTNAGDVDGPPDIGPILSLPIGTHTALYGIQNDGNTIAGALINDGTVAFSVNTAGLGLSDVVVGIGNTGIIDGGIVNNGLIDVAARDDGAFADVALAVGVAQVAFGATGTATTFLNSLGAILEVSALATDTAAPGNASATAFGLFQSVSALLGDATAAVTNEGLIGVFGSAGVTAPITGAITATANASALGIFQQIAAPSGDAFAIVLNAGTLNVTAGASALQTVLNASANAAGIAISQIVVAETIANALVSNDGAINVDVFGTAVGFPAATANAAATGVRQDVSAGGTAGNANASFVNTIVGTGAAADIGSLDVHGHAAADASTAANATAYALGVFQTVAASASASARIVNLGTINVAATASATASSTAGASASAVGVAQEVNTTGTAVAFISNDGTVDVVALAVASAGSAGDGYAFALALDQAAGEPNVAGDATGSIINSGVINVLATAREIGFATADTVSDAFANAADQIVSATGAGLAFFSNAGTIDVQANAFGENGPDAEAYAVGVYQTVVQGVTATASLINSGQFSVAAAASVSGGAAATAGALGIFQVATAVGTALVRVINSGTIDVAANATAAGAGSAAAVAFAWGGVRQDVGPAPELFAGVFNDGTINASAQAVATGGGSAAASANAAGVIQGAHGGYDGGTAQVAVLSVVNSGTIEAGAHAEATGSALVFANAVAGGVEQDFTEIGATGTQTGQPTVTGVVHNSGHFEVSATAFAGGGTANTARAFAAGIDVDAAFGLPDGAILNVDITNSGSSIRVFAGAEVDGDGVASASAIGIEIDGGVVVGRIVNAGLIDVEAFATGGSTAIANAGGITVAALTFNGTISNVDGTIIAVASGQTASAYGIRVTGYATGYGTGTGTIDIEDATIFAGVNGGHGVAIDVSNAPNAIDINFAGTADIFGDILLSSDDVVNVGGRVYFDGAVNPYATTFTSAAAGIFNVTGTLTIANNGDLGPASVNVGVFNQGGAGVLVFEARGEDGSDSEWSMGQIFANTANLDGTAVVRLLTGLYDDTEFENVVVALDLNGQWDDVQLDRNYLFFDVDAVYNSGSVDIQLNRSAFDSLAGMTANEAALAGGIENAYSPTLSGSFGALAQNLLFQTSANTFIDYMRQLSGVEHGQKVHAELQVQNLLKDIVTQQLQTVPEMGARTGGFTLNSVWLSGFGSWGNMDGNESAGGYDSNVYGVVGGIDFKVGASGKVGGTIGYASGDIDFDRYNNTAGYSGWNLGLYGRYDATQFYLQGVGSYGMYDNDVARNIDIVAVDAPASSHRDLSHPDAGIDFASQPGLLATSGTADSTYSSDVWALYGEAGWKANLGTNFSVTPFVGLNYLYGESDSFLESGAAGANLEVHRATGRSFASLLGVRLTGNNMLSGMTTLIPHARIAWQHEFLDQIWGVDARFLNASSSDFTVRGLGYGQDSALLGVGVNIGFSGAFLLKLGYDGRFSSDRTDHSVIGKITLLVGGGP